AGQIDFADYPYETPYAYDNQTTTRPVAPYTFSVRAASTANVASLSGPQTIDGYSLIANDYVLLKNQTTHTENGVYQVKAGAWVAV
ncbi:hypothetical protein, partial [Enterococcus faecalis]|uniref:hypothetical protein n=1 Tax=Enterococcus faecalis TaxID=1351 RepID=UPI00403FAA3D